MLFFTSVCFTRLAAFVDLLKNYFPCVNIENASKEWLLWQNKRWLRKGHDVYIPLDLIFIYQSV